jgi:hypothetical protein
MFITPQDALLRQLSYQLLFGSIAGIASWIITYPFDIVKTTIQTTDGHLRIRDVIRVNYKQHGSSFF